jgi:beta-alanine--pyruvate transaminase
MNKLSKDEMQNYWMPFTGNRDFLEAPRVVTRAKGIYFYDQDDNAILDGSSGLFCTPLGHCRDEITKAVSEQIATLDYMSPFQSAHPLAFKFAQALAGILPESLNHIFFSNSGSESIETAIKVAYAYHYANGEGQRTRFVSRERAYHGVNMGGISLGGMVKNRQAYGLGLSGVVHMRHTWQQDQHLLRGQAETGAELADDLERMALNYGADTIAACIVEPIAGSTGCLVPPKGYLQRLREICDKYGILLIFDEVITGFGRTGNAFAADTFGVTPDIMTMAKALTNSAQPMGATAISDKVHDVILNAAPEKAIELFHGYTYSAHPVACAAGLATLDIIQKEGLFEKAAKLSEYFLDAVFSLQDIDIISDIRGFGLLAGIDLVPDTTPCMRGLALQKTLFHNGLHLKTTGDTGLIAPPFICEEKDIDKMMEILRASLKKL